MNTPSKTSRPSPVGESSGAVVFLLAGTALVLVGICSLATLWVIQARITSRFDNEWVEGQIAVSAIRVAEGLSLYPSPSPEYVGDNYPPLYFWVCGAVTAVVGHPMIVCRVVSVVSTLFICAAIFWTPQRCPVAMRVFLAAGFLAFYSAALEWYDLARIDMLAHALAAWGCVVAIRGERDRSGIVGGIFLGLSVITKHNLIIVVAAMAIGLLFRAVRRGLIVGTLAAAIPIIVFAALHVTSDGWSTHYLFIQPGEHEFISKKFFQFLDGDIGAHGMILWVLLATWAMTVGRDSGRGAFLRKALPPILLAMGGVGATLPARLKFGGAANNLIPMWTFLLLAVAWSIPQWLHDDEATANRQAKYIPGFWAAMIGVGLSLCGTYGTIWGQAELYGNLARRDEDIRRFHERVASLSEHGAVWTTRNSLYSVGSEFKTMAHGAPIRFLQNSDIKPAHDVFYESLNTYLTGPTRPAAIVLNFPFHPEFEEAIKRAGYVEGGLILQKNHLCVPLTGYKTAPHRVLISRERIKTDR